VARNYREEYRRRIERLETQGFSRSQARGHPKTRTKIHDDGTRYTVKIERSIRVERIRTKIETDRRRVFGGELPRRQRGESRQAFENRLETLRVAEGYYDWEDQDGFMEMMRDEGLSEHEGFEIWFGY
jgi:hypothetical protein